MSETTYWTIVYVMVAVAVSLSLLALYLIHKTYPRKKMNFPKDGDSERFWSESKISKRVEYLSDCFDCDKDNPTVASISQQNWNTIPNIIKEIIEGSSQFGNDVFDSVNE